MEFINKEQFKYNIGIYAIKNLINNKVYIGQTGENFLRRYLHHDWKLRNNSHDNEHLQRAFNKYGSDNFVFEIVEIVDNSEELNELEIFYIDKYRELNICYNMLGGGGGRRGYSMKESTKEKIGAKNREHMLGRKHSEETKMKMTLARTNQPYTRHKITTVITENIAKIIKEKLVKGETPKQIAIDLNIDYKIVNNILASDAWYNVEVNGWEEFQATRKRLKKSSLEEQKEIYNLYINGMSKEELAEKYDKGIKAIEKNIRKIRKLYENPVPSLE